MTRDRVVHRAPAGTTSSAPAKTASSAAARQPVADRTNEVHAVQGGGVVLLAGAVGLLVLAAAAGVLLREMVAIRGQWPGEARG